MDERTHWKRTTLVIRPARSKSQKEHKSRVNETPYFGAKPEVVYELGEKVQKVR